VRQWNEWGAAAYIWGKFSASLKGHVVVREFQLHYAVEIFPKTPTVKIFFTSSFPLSHSLNHSFREARCRALQWVNRV
jgi:hypothetical protein